MVQICCRIFILPSVFFFLPWILGQNYYFFIYVTYWALLQCLGAAGSTGKAYPISSLLIITDYESLVKKRK